MTSQPTVKSIICIPGTWKDRSEIVTSIASANLGEYIFAGKILLNLKTQLGFEVEICERDDRMRESFKWAGMVNRVPEEFLDEIDQHTFVIYIIGESGDLERARAVAEAAQSILRSGGIGIKVETAGKAFTPEHWNDLLDSEEEASLYQMFVIDSLRDEHGTVNSCGMHNLGLKDTIVYDEDFQDAVDLISIFGYYQLVDKPTISNGQTFSVAPDAQVYKILEEENPPYEGDELFGNPFGVWKLVRQG